jgi:flagellin-like protein
MIRHKSQKKGVSPILATILMVAITVTLAFCLWATSGCGCGGGSQSPNGVITKTEKIDNHTEKLTLGTFYPDTKWSDLRISCNDGVNTWGFNVNMGIGGILNFTLRYGTNPVMYPSGMDNAANDKINSNDYLVIRMNGAGFVSANPYTVNIMYVLTGVTICEKSFTQYN